MGATKTDTAGTRREKPLHGPAAQALSNWLTAAPAQTGPLFRRPYKGGKVGSAGLSADQVARIVQRRAKLAGLDSDWAAHSLRSDFVTQAGRQGVPLGEVIAMTEHRGITTVMGYFQAGLLLNSRATELLPSLRLTPKHEDPSETNHLRASGDHYLSGTNAPPTAGLPAPSSPGSVLPTQRD